MATNSVWERQVVVVGREVQAVVIAVAEVEAGPSEFETAEPIVLVPTLLSRIFRVVGGGNLNPVPWNLDNPASRLSQSVSSVLRHLSSYFVSLVYENKNCIFNLQIPVFARTLVSESSAYVALRHVILSPRVSLPLNVEERYLISTLHCDSEACVKR